MFNKKQQLLKSVTDTKRRRQVEVNEQKKKRKTELSNSNPQGLNPAGQQDPQEPQGSRVINQTLLEKELNRESQFKRAQILINHLFTNMTALEAAHDQYEECLNGANDPYESQLG